MALRDKFRRSNSLVWLAAAAFAVLGLAADDKSAFHAKPAQDYPHKLTSESVTIAAQPFETDEEAKEAFGKVNPWRYGALPVLIVIQNNGKDTINFDRMLAVYDLPDGQHVEATPAAELKYLRGAKKPSGVPTPIGGIAISRAPKNPLAEWEIEGRAFSAKVLPAGQSASGFVYFQVPQTSAAANLQISGIRNAATGKDLFYFDIPLSGR